MQLAVSNIAWAAADDAAAADVLTQHGIRFLEMAPTRYWPDLAEVSQAQATDLASSLPHPVVAFQALLFGKPELTVFGTDDGIACRTYLKAVCRLAGWLGVKALVFGSPKQRLRGGLADALVLDKATDFFRDVGDAAAAAGVKFCLEPNPTVYGADFLTQVDEAAELVSHLDHPGIALNFDMGEQLINGQDAAANIRRYAGLIGHFHASEPMLAPLPAGSEAHAQAATALRQMRYQGTVSLEMKQPEQGLTTVSQCVQQLVEYYGVHI